MIPSPAPFGLSFYRLDGTRALVLQSFDPFKSAKKVLADYGLGSIDFINVFENGTFKFRYYVADGELSRYAGVIYQLREDRALLAVSVASAPVIGLIGILAMAERSRQIELNRTLSKFNSFLTLTK